MIIFATAGDNEPSDGRAARPRTHNSRRFCQADPYTGYKLSRTRPADSEIGGTTFKIPDAIGERDYKTYMRLSSWIDD